MLTPKLDATTKQHGLLPTLGGGTTNFLRADGTWSAPPLATPGGSDGQIQYNSSGAFAGDANLTWDGTNVAIGGTPSGAVAGMSIIASPSTTPFRIEDLSGNGLFGLNIDAFGQPDAAFGDEGGSANGVYFRADNPNAIAKMGSDVIGPMFAVDCGNGKTTSNVKHEASGDITITDDTKGLVLKSPNGHYWRSAMSNAGALTWTDIGTSPP